MLLWGAGSVQPSIFSLHYYKSLTMEESSLGMAPWHQVLVFVQKGEHVMKFEMAQAKKIESKLDIAFSLGNLTCLKVLG